MDYMIRYSKWVLVLLGLIFPHMASGQSSAGFGVRSWRMMDGVPSDQVLDVAQRQNGFIWLATPNGVARFDGLRFEVFRKGTHAGLANNHVESLYEEPSGHLLSTVN